jgi:AraC-like DNA-binding protein
MSDYIDVPEHIPDVHFKKSVQAESGLDIVTLEDIYDHESMDHDPSRPHRVGFHCLLYIEGGLGQHFIDFNAYDLVQGHCVFIHKHQVHAFDFDNRPQGLLLLFTDAFIDTIRTNISTDLFSPLHFMDGYSPIVDLNGELNVRFQRVLIELMTEHQDLKCDPLMLQLLFSCLILKLDKQREQGVSTQLRPEQIRRFNHFMTLLERDYRMSKNATDYAAQLSTSYKSLNLLCKQVCQKTAKQIIDDHVILQAKRKLVTSQSHIQTLAFELGFDEVGNFVKYFKKHAGMTPAQFRKTY